MNDVEKERQKGTGIEREGRMLPKVRKVACRKRQILLLDQMIQLEKSVGFLAVVPKPQCGPCWRPQEKVATTAS